MDTVYLVLKDKYEPFCVAVFSTYLKAQDYIQRCEDYDPEKDNYDIEGWEVDNADLVS